MSILTTEYHRKIWSLLLMLSVCMFVSAEANQPIDEIFTKGLTNRWEVNVDGEKNKLIIRGSINPTSNDSHKIEYSVAWGEHLGTLIGFNDTKNKRQLVTLKLTRKNGVRVTCRGSIPQNTDNYMSGTCINKGINVKWDAVRNISQGPTIKQNRKKGSKRKNSSGQKKTFNCKNAYSRLLVENKKFRRNNNHYQSLLNQCYKDKDSLSPSNTTTTVPFSSFKNKINGNYYGGDSNDKSDSVGTRLFPKRSSNELDLWLKEHNNSLLAVVYGLLNTQDFKSFTHTEKQKCESIYCQIGFRQQTIHCALGIGC